MNQSSVYSCLYHWSDGYLCGARVAILNKDMPCSVLQGFPVYNLILGVFSLFPITFLIWKKAKFSIPASIAILASHSIILLILLIAYLGTVSIFSLGAMPILTAKAHNLPRPKMR